MAKYRVGDKVRIVKKWDPKGTQNSNGKMDKWLGQTMTVRNVCDCFYQMEEDLGRWAWDLSTIAGFAEIGNKIVITTDGSTTTARLYDGEKVVKFASVQCHEDDTFDFTTGARIAFDRLIGEETKDGVTVAEKRKPKYKVGDRVRIVRFIPTFPVDCRENYAGSVLTIRTVYENKYERGVAYGVGKPFVVYEDEIEAAGYTGRAVCVLPGVGCDKAFTSGRIYTFVDKETVDDHGNKAMFKREDDIYIGDGVEKFIKIKE